MTWDIKNNKGKLAVLFVYLLIALVVPFSGHLPFVGDYLKQSLPPLVPKDIDPFFRQYIQALKQGDIEKTYSFMVPQARDNIATSSLLQLSDLLSSTNDQIEGVALDANTVYGQGTRYEVTYEIGNDDPMYKYVLAEIFARDVGDGMRVERINVSGRTHSIHQKTEFDFTKQGPYLLASILLPLFIAYTGLRYIRRAEKPSWILFLVILLFSIYLGLVYQAGNVTLRLNIGVYGATYASSLGYWVYMIPIPLGAIYYWVRRKHYEHKAESVSK